MDPRPAALRPGFLNFFRRHAWRPRWGAVASVWGLGLALGLGLGAAELLRVGLQHAALLAPYAQAFFGRRGPGLVLAWPFRYAWHEGYGGLLGLSLLGLAGLGLLYGGALAGMLCLLDARRMLRFPVALAILLAFGGLAMALAVEPVVFLAGLPLLGLASLVGFRRHFGLGLGNGLLAWSAATMLGLLAFLALPFRAELFSLAGLRAQVTRPRDARRPTPREKAERRREIARLWARPTVEPHATERYVRDATLPAALRFRIAKEKAAFDPVSMFLLGCCYDEAIGTARDPEQARAWWGRAIQACGHAGAKLALGLALLEGRGHPYDPEAGRELVGSVLRWRRQLPPGLMPKLEALGQARALPEWDVRLAAFPAGGVQDLEALRLACGGDPLFWPYQEILRGREASLGLEGPEAANPEGEALPPPGEGGAAAGAPSSKVELLFLFRSGSRRLRAEELAQIQDEEPMAQVDLGCRQWEGGELPRDPASAVRLMEEGLNRADAAQRQRQAELALRACTFLSRAYAGGAGTAQDPARAQAWRDTREQIRRLREAAGR